MGNRRSRAERSGDEGSLDKFGSGGAGLARVAAVDVDAIRTLRGESDADGDELFVLHRDRSLSDGRAIKCPKGLHDLRREDVHFPEVGEVVFGIDRLIHGNG